MTVYKCDRCNKVYFKRADLAKLRMFGFGNAAFHALVEFDICEDCVYDFSNFLGVDKDKWPDILASQEDKKIVYNYYTDGKLKKADDEMLRYGD